MPLLLLILVAALAGGLAAGLALRYPDAAPGATAAPVARAAARNTGIHRWLRARRDPAVATGLLLTFASVAAVVGGVVIAVLAYLVRQDDAVRRADAWAARWGHDHATDASDAAITAVTQMGETWFVVIAGLVIAALERRRGSSWLVVPFLIAVVLGDKLVTTAIKELADRARPTLNPIAETLGPSFPSGHASTAAAFFAGAALVLGRARPRRVRVALAGVAVGLAVAVAASRVLLDVHWMSDVVAGLALGWAWFALCSIAFGGRLLRFGATAERAEAAAGRATVGTPRA
jgi:membrane-associated phospholipid phosphatase